MKEDDPRGELDQFTRTLVEKLRSELEFAIKQLISADKDIAEAQIDVLHKRTIHRLKTLDFDFEIWKSEMVDGELPEGDILKIARITIAAVEQTMDLVREFIVDIDEARFRMDGDPDLSE